jgi:O-antigen ligase
VYYQNSQFVQSLPGGRMFTMPLGGNALVALGIVAFIFAALVAYSRERRMVRMALALFIVLLGIGGAYLWHAGKLPSLADPTTSTRFWVWQEAWKGFLERPVLGWGPENFTAVYDKYFDPRFFIPGQSTETWYDRAHSVFFDYLVETGIVGFLSYLSIFGVLGWEFFRPKRAKAEAPAREERAPSVVLERGLIVSLPVAYLVQGVAIFDVLPMYINIFLFVAFASYYFNYSHGQNS